MIVVPENAGMVNIIPAKDTFDQDEIVQLHHFLIAKVSGCVGITDAYK